MIPYSSSEPEPEFRFRSSIADIADIGNQRRRET